MNIKLSASADSIFADISKIEGLLIDANIKKHI